MARRLCFRLVSKTIVFVFDGKLKLAKWKNRSAHHMHWRSDQSGQCRTKKTCSENVHREHNNGLSHVKEMWKFECRQAKEKILPILVFRPVFFSYNIRQRLVLHAVNWWQWNALCVRVYEVKQNTKKKDFHPTFVQTWLEYKTSFVPRVC